MIPTRSSVDCQRLVIYCQTTSVSAAHATHRATCCTPCRPLIRAFSGWNRTLPPTRRLRRGNEQSLRNQREFGRQRDCALANCCSDTWSVAVVQLSLGRCWGFSSSERKERWWETFLSLYSRLKGLLGPGSRGILKNEEEAVCQEPPTSACA